MKTFIALTLLGYSINGFTTLLPNPKFAIDPVEEKESQESNNKRREAAVKLIARYYDAYIAELKHINNSEIDPNLRATLMLAGKNASDELLHVPPQAVLKGVRGFLNEVITNPVIEENGLKTALTKLIDSATGLNQRSVDLENEINSQSTDNQVQYILNSLAPSKNQKYANIILAELFLLMIIISFRRKS